MEETIKLIVFNLGEVSFGILMTKIDRVVNKTNLDRDFNFSAEIEILDLHHRLFGSSIGIPSNLSPLKITIVVGLTIELPNKR